MRFIQRPTEKGRHKGRKEADDYAFGFMYGALNAKRSFNTIDASKTPVIERFETTGSREASTRLEDECSVSLKRSYPSKRGAPTKILTVEG